MLGRGVVNKHKAYAFHRPSSLWIAQIFVDQVFSVSQIMLFSLIVYFTTNLFRSAGAFFIFFLMILSGNVSICPCIDGVSANLTSDCTYSTHALRDTEAGDWQIPMHR